MKADWSGFLRPGIDSTKCIDCGLCQKTCPANHSIQKFQFGKAIAFIEKNEKYLNRASSGGAFGAMARHIISLGGIVYGASMDGDYNVFYKGIETIDDLMPLHGSKYVQAYTGNVYREVKAHLKAGRFVLFCGCPCQVDALNKFLVKDYERLITMDLICHGVPSQPYFRDYVHDLLKRRRKSGVKSFSFRYVSVSESDVNDSSKSEVHVGWHNRDYYMTYFLWGKGYRPSCYQCKYAGGERNGDFTIGDFWNNDKAKIFKRIQHGASLILINTDKAEALRHVFENSGECHDMYTLEDAMPGAGGQLMHPSKYDLRCKLIYVLYKTLGLVGPKLLFKLDNLRLRGK